MFIWLILVDVAAIVLGIVFASKMDKSPVASTVGSGLGQLLSGIWTLQMTSEVVMGMDRDWREFLLDTVGSVGYFAFQFLGWGCVVLGIGTLVYAIIQTIENQKKQQMPQWAAAPVSQAQPPERPQAQPQQAQTPTNEPAKAYEADFVPAVSDEHEAIFCPRCGRKQRKSRTKCWDCGASLED